MDITWFPFDEQHCFLIYESKRYEGRELNATLEFPAVVLGFYQPSGEWSLVGN